MIANDFIRGITLTSLLLFFVSITSAQMKNQGIEIKDIIFKKDEVLSFIDANFKEYKPLDLSDIIEQQHHSNKDRAVEIHYKLNRVPKIDTIGFAFFGLPINEVFANKQGADKFALYFTCYLDQATLDNLLVLIGRPENLLENEQISVNDNMYFWPLKGMDMMISRSPFGSFKGKWTISISNLKYHDQRRI